MKNETNNIFFDIDGTLIDTSERHYRIYKDILYSYGIQKIFSKRKFWNQKREGKKTVEIIYKKSFKQLKKNFAHDWLTKIEDRKYLKFDKLFSGCLNVLSDLKKTNDLIFVTMRNNKKNLLWELDNFGLNKYCSKIIVGSPIDLKSKVPLINKYIIKNQRGKNIIIGDTEMDIAAGKKLGILTIASIYGIRSKQFLSRLEPDYYLSKLSKLPKILKRVENDSIPEFKKT
ncbi:MAG: HAD family hydrolase [Elusimicrobia bacterium]|nr:HAD family hydrolase [Elusimicrobiota bacterium]